MAKYGNIFPKTFNLRLLQKSELVRSQHALKDTRKRQPFGYNSPCKGSNNPKLAIDLLESVLLKEIRFSYF